MRNNAADQDLMRLPEALLETIQTLEILCAIVRSYGPPQTAIAPLEEQLVTYRNYSAQLTTTNHRSTS